MRIKIFIIFFLLSFFIVMPASICFSKGMREQIGERFAGEILKYEVGFWIFSPAGKGVVNFKDLGYGRYKVFHEGKASGVIGWLTGQRREIYRSFMATINEGRRLIPLKFEEEIISFGRVRNKVTTYDYYRHKIIIERIKDGEKSIQAKEIPYGILYDDPVTAFYNFRHQVYGQIAPGKEFVLRTIPEKGEEIILIRVASAREIEMERAKEVDKKGKDFLVRVILNREMWGKRKVEIEIWFDKELTPISGVVKDLPFLGDTGFHEIRNPLILLTYSTCNFLTCPPIKIPI